MKIENERDWEREEKLFHAIGNLPEDMIAQAAEYKRPQSKLFGLPVWKRFAVAACAALAIFGGAKFISVVQERSGQNVEKSNEMQLAAEESKGASQKEADQNETKESNEDVNRLHEDDQIRDGDADIVEGSHAVAGTAEIKLWASGTMASGEITADSEKDTAKQNSQKDSSSELKNEGTSDAQILMKEGNTVALQTKDMKGIDGEELAVITFQIGQEEDNVSYTLHSQTSNCKIITIAHEGLQKYVNLPNAECASGDVAAFDTRQFASVDWAYDIVPEWIDTMNVIDIIDICEKGEDDKENKLGRIVIGQQTEGEEQRFYGIYQNKND